MSTHEKFELVPEHEIRELLKPRQPDPKKFQAGVARRIAELERAQDEKGASPSPLHSAWIRRVAVLLPPDAAAAMFGGGKWLSSMLALPALVLAMAFGGFAAGARSLAHSSRNAEPATTPGTRYGRRATSLNRDMAQGAGLIMLIQFSTLALILAPLFVGSNHMADLIIAVLLVSMGALVLSVRGMARAGLLRREEVAKLCGALLAAIFSSCFLWSRSFHLVNPDSELGVSGSSLAVLAGMLVCAFFARKAPGIPRGFPVLMLALVVGILAFFPPWATKSSDSALRGYLQGFEADASDMTGWAEAGATYEALRAVGAALPDLEHVRSAVNRAIESGADAAPTVYTVAARMQLVDAKHWRTLAAGQLEHDNLDQLLALDGTLRAPWYDEYRFPMLLATRNLNEGQREHLVRRVAASWPALDDKSALAAVAQCVRLFDWLGRADQVEARRAQIHDVLRRHWVSGRDSGVFDKVGGFTSYPDQFRTSFDDSTWLGVELIARVGAPEGVNLRLLRAHVRLECLALGVFPEEWPYLNQLSRSSLARIEREIGLPQRSWLAVLLGERLLVSTVLIVLLCFAAIFMAAPADLGLLGRVRSGAQP